MQLQKIAELALVNSSTLFAILQIHWFIENNMIVQNKTQADLN